MRRNNRNAAVQEPARETKPWRLDDSREKYVKPLTEAEQGKYDHFKGLVASGTPPDEAAETARVTPYKKLSDGRWQGKLSKGKRFTAQHGTSRHPETGEEHPTVFMHEAGGHT